LEYLNDLFSLQEINFFFPMKIQEKKFAPQSTGIFKNCTCCVVKPHIISDGMLKKKKESII
jgi:hypothetical protein